MKRIGWLHVFAQIALAAHRRDNLGARMRSQDRSQDGTVQTMFEHAFDDFADAFRATIRFRV